MWANALSHAFVLPLFSDLLPMAAQTRRKCICHLADVAKMCHQFNGFVLGVRQGPEKVGEYDADLQYLSFSHCNTDSSLQCNLFFCDGFMSHQHFCPYSHSLSLLFLLFLSADEVNAVITVRTERHSHSYLCLHHFCLVFCRFTSFMLFLSFVSVFILYVVFDLLYLLQYAHFVLLCLWHTVTQNKKH